VLRGEKETNFLILSYADVLRHVRQNNIKTVDKDRRYRMNTFIRDGKVYLGNLKNDISFHFNNWGLIR